MRFSIITCTYNRAHLIGETIQSVLNQTFQDFEMIIIDDGSEDDTKTVVSRFIKEHPTKFIYIPHEHIGMLSILRNQAIEMATGDIISILDSDDLWLPTKLEEMHSIFTKDDTIQFVFHNLQYFTKIDELEPPYYSFPNSFHKNAIKEILTDEILAFPVYAMRRSLLKDIGPVNEKIVEGQNEYYIKAAALHKIYYHNKVLTLMRRHNQNFTKEFNIVHTLDAITTYNNLRERKFLTDKQYIMASNLVDYKIAKYYFKKNQNHKAQKHLNAIFKRSYVLDLWYLKSKLLKFIPYLRR